MERFLILALLSSAVAAAPARTPNPMALARLAAEVRIEPPRGPARLRVYRSNDGSTYWAEPLVLVRRLADGFLLIVSQRAALEHLMSRNVIVSALPGLQAVTLQLRHDRRFDQPLMSPLDDARFFIPSHERPANGTVWVRFFGAGRDAMTQQAVFLPPGVASP